VNWISNSHGHQGKANDVSGLGLTPMNTVMSASGGRMVREVTRQMAVGTSGTKEFAWMPVIRLIRGS